MIGIDLFAGLGGWTEGAENAGCEIVWAANHSPKAVKWHSANHPRTKHSIQDLRQADFSEAPSHNVLIASSSCKGHTPARGKDKPRHDGERSTAWAVVECAEVNREDALLLENVPAFLKWELYPAFKLALEALGYALAPHIIDAADHGVPQNRVRVFIVCTRSKNPLWLKLPRRLHVPASQIIGGERHWSSVRSHCLRTRERVRAGRKLFGDRFLVPYYGSARGGRSLDRPLGTVTTCERFALVEGDRMGMVTVPEYRRAMSFPDTYLLPDNKHDAVALLGDAVPPVVAEDIVRALKEAA
jgi:DNA (cytosine-5)-methyltransferase 1